MTSTEIEIHRFDSDSLAGITDFQSAIQLAIDEFGLDQIIDSTTIGDGFRLISTEDKGTLVGVPFIILDIRVGYDIPTSRHYCVLRLVTSDSRKIIVSDGSTGIYRDLCNTFGANRNGDDDVELNWSRKPFAPVLVKAGLTRSDYVTSVNGKNVSATTYYLGTDDVAL